MLHEHVVTIMLAMLAVGVGSGSTSSVVGGRVSVEGGTAGGWSSATGDWDSCSGTTCILL